MYVRYIYRTNKYNEHVLTHISTESLRATNRIRIKANQFFNKKKENLKKAKTKKKEEILMTLLQVITKLSRKLT